MKITLELTEEQEFFLKKLYESLDGKETIENIASNMLNQGIVDFVTEIDQKIFENLKKGNVA